MIRKVLLGIVLGLVALGGLGYALGWWDFDDIRREAISDEKWSEIKTKAQVEEARIKAKAQALTSDSGEDPRQAAELCRQNLRRIEAAKRTFANRTGLTAGPIAPDQVLRELGGVMPVCPKGGKYAPGTIEQLPRCSLGGQGTPDTSDDHVITTY